MGSMFSRLLGAALARAAGFARLMAFAPLALAAPWFAPQGAGAASNPAEGTVRVGDMAPLFTLPTVNGATLSLSNHVGKKPVVLVFWSFFCFPCQRELPELEEFVKGQGADQVSVIGISLDGPRYSERVVPFLQAKGITFPNVYDKETEDYFEMAEKYGVVGTPTYFLLDLDGRVRLIHLGRLDTEALAGAVRASRDRTFCSEITKIPRPAAP